MTAPIVFLDLETTGIDPHESSILEAALLLVNANISAVEVDFACTIDWPTLPPIPDAAVLEMHRKSGLIDDLRAKRNALCLADADRSMHDIIATRATTRKAIIAGYSPHFDLRFLEQHMPQTFSLFSHQTLNVSSFRTLTERVVKDADEFNEGMRASLGPSRHRALDDCLRAFAELQMYVPGMAMVFLEEVL